MRWSYDITGSFTAAGIFVSRKPRDSRVVQKKACADDVEIKTPFVVK